MVDDWDVHPRVRWRIAINRICKENTKYFCHLPTHFRGDAPLEIGPSIDLRESSLTASWIAPEKIWSGLLEQAQPSGFVMYATVQARRAHDKHRIMFILPSALVVAMPINQEYAVLIGPCLD